MSERRSPAPQHAIDYDVLLSGAKDHGAFDPASFLQQRLPSTGQDVYLSTISHEPNFVRFRHRTLLYICDLYSLLEVTGSVPYDQTIADRVIGAFGTSSRAQEHRSAKRQSRPTLPVASGCTFPKVAAPTQPVGQAVSHYRILRKIGRRRWT